MINPSEFLSLEELIAKHGPHAYYMGHCKCGAVLDYENVKFEWEKSWSKHLADEIRNRFVVS